VELIKYLKSKIYLLMETSIEMHKNIIMKQCVFSERYKTIFYCVSYKIIKLLCQIHLTSCKVLSIPIQMFDLLNDGQIRLCSSIYYIEYFRS